MTIKIEMEEVTRLPICSPFSMGTMTAIDIDLLGGTVAWKCPRSEEA